MVFRNGVIGDTIDSTVSLKTLRAYLLLRFPSFGIAPRLTTL